MRNYFCKFTFARPKMKRAPRRSRGALEVLLHARRNGEVQAEPGLVHSAHAAARPTAASTCACSGPLIRSGQSALRIGLAEKAQIGSLKIREVRKNTRQIR